MTKTHPLERYRAREAKRRGAPLRRRDLAKEIGCSASRYTQITKHGESPSFELARKIKAVCGIKMDALASAALEAAE